MSIHYIQHVPYETPGYIEQWSEQRNVHQTTTNPVKEQTFPEPDSNDLVVVLGGPMSVYQEKEHPWISREKTFLNECVQSDIKTIGICLGAQLIADVLGADVYPMGGRERGWAPITWTDTAQQHPMFQHFPEKHSVFHWHGDTYELPENALHLAKSGQCTQQAFLIPDRVLGLQFHLEITDSIVNDLFQRAGTASSSPEPSKDPENKSFHQNHVRLGQLLDRFMDEC